MFRMYKVSGGNVVIRHLSIYAWAEFKIIFFLTINLYQLSIMSTLTAEQVSKINRIFANHENVLALAAANDPKIGDLLGQFQTVLKNPTLTKQQLYLAALKYQKAKAKAPEPDPIEDLVDDGLDEDGNSEDAAEDGDDFEESEHQDDELDELDIEQEEQTPVAKAPFTKAPPAQSQPAATSKPFTPVVVDEADLVDDDFYCEDIDLKEVEEAPSVKASTPSRPKSNATTSIKDGVNTINRYLLMRNGSYELTNPNSIKTSWDFTVTTNPEEIMLKFILGTKYDDYMKTFTSFHKFVDGLIKSHKCLFNEKSKKYFTVKEVGTAGNKTIENINYIAKDLKENSKTHTPEAKDKSFPLPENELAEYAKFHNAFNTTFKVGAKDIPEGSSLLGLLLTDVVKTPFVFDMKFLLEHELINPQVPSEFLHSTYGIPTNASLVDKDKVNVKLAKWWKSEIVRQTKDATPTKQRKIASEYKQMCELLASFRGTSFNTLIPKIWKLHTCLLFHPILIKKSTNDNPFGMYLWARARGALSLVQNPSEIVRAWQNILSSYCMFCAFMFGAPMSKCISNAVAALVKHKESLKLFSNELYTISWMFTPLMVGGRDLAYKSVENVSKVQYSATVSEYFSSFANSDEDTNFNTMNWLYYVVNEDRETSNKTLSLLQHAIDEHVNKPDEAPKKKAAKVETKVEEVPAPESKPDEAPKKKAAKVETKVEEAKPKETDVLINFGDDEENA